MRTLHRQNYRRQAWKIAFVHSNIIWTHFILRKQTRSGKVLGNFIFCFLIIYFCQDRAKSSSSARFCRSRWSRCRRSASSYKRSKHVCPLVMVYLICLPLTVAMPLRQSAGRKGAHGAGAPAGQQMSDQCESSRGFPTQCGPQSCTPQTR